MRAAAAGVHGRLEEPGRPRHMQDRLRVLGLTGCDTGCRCGLYRASDLLYLAVQGAIPVTVAVSLSPAARARVAACLRLYRVVPPPGSIHFPEKRAAACIVYMHHGTLEAWTAATRARPATHAPAAATVTLKKKQ
jgi:hypothetical protein